MAARGAGRRPPRPPGALEAAVPFEALPCERATRAEESCGDEAAPALGPPPESVFKTGGGLDDGGFGCAAPVSARADLKAVAAALGAKVHRRPRGRAAGERRRPRRGRAHSAAHHAAHGRTTAHVVWSARMFGRPTWFRCGLAPEDLVRSPALVAAVGTTGQEVECLVPRLPRRGCSRRPAPSPTGPVAHGVGTALAPSGSRIKFRIPGGR
ncbi:hypothetical protein QJS66_01925 [Kocuria rhizophila]|nr:hypothetical protein QJS66_01925 [Kocuria rhizophila]